MLESEIQDTLNLHIKKIPPDNYNQMVIIEVVLMTVQFWPLDSVPEDGFSLKKRLSSIRKSHSDLFSLFDEKMVRLSQPGATVESLGASYSNKMTGHSGISELRIPPSRRGGVGRYYYCNHPKETDTIVILDAEAKANGKATASRTILKACDSRYRAIQATKL